MNLTFPNQSDLNDLFSCKTWERVSSDGRKRFDGIVMDGTAMGILGNLPNFVRIKSHFPRVPNISNRQYIMRTPRLRHLVDSIMVSAKLSSGLTTFEFPLNKSLWDKKEYLLNQFFNNSIGVEHENFYVARFLRSIVSLCGTRDPTNDTFEDNEDEYSPRPSGAIRMPFNIDDTDIRRTSIDFDRCFAAG